MTINKKLLLLLLSISCCTNSFSQVVRNAIDNTVKSVFFADNMPSYDNIVDVLAKNLELDKEQVFVKKYSTPQSNGSVIERYILHYQNHPIEHSSASVMIKDNKIAFINANVYQKSAFANTGNILTEAEALQFALQNINAQEYMWESVVQSKFTENNSSYKPPVGTLVWVEDFYLEQSERQLHLAYKFDIYAKKPESRDMILCGCSNW